jgi:hypothetical protein
LLLAAAVRLVHAGLLPAAGVRSGGRSGLWAKTQTITMLFGVYTGRILKQGAEVRLTRFSD